MKSVVDIIKTLESDNSRLFKEKVLSDEMKLDNGDLFYGLKLALSKFYTFGVKQVPVKEDENTLHVLSPDVTWTKFLDLSNKLMTRELSGNAAKIEIQRLMIYTDMDIWNYWYRRILTKDMKCGIDEKTVNKCAKTFGKFAIPTFSCQLAKDSREHENKMKGIKLCDMKMDGSRVLSIVYPNGIVEQFSRNGKAIVNFPHIKTQFEMVAQSLTEPTVFDGEIMASSFQDLMSQLYRKDNINTSDTNLFLFDMIPLKFFQEGVDKTKQIIRSEKLHKWYSEVEPQLSNVKVLTYKLINLDTEEGQTQFKELNSKALLEGKEGIMIKDPNAPYECKRSASWLKLKPFITVDLDIIDIEEGTGKNEGALGAFICKGFDEEGRLIETNVGGGFTESQRSEIWEDKESYIGKVVEVKGDGITQNKNGTYSVRFPVFMRFRDDK
jgi:DNA ligase-1